MTHSSYSEMSYSSQLMGAHMAPQLDAAPLPISQLTLLEFPPCSPPHISDGVTPSEVADLIGERTRGVSEKVLTDISWLPQGNKGHRQACQND